MNTSTDRLHAASPGTPEQGRTLSRRSLARALAGGGLVGAMGAAFSRPGEARERKQRKTKKAKGSNTKGSKEDRALARVAEIMAAALTIDDGKGGGAGGGRLVLDEAKLDGLDREQAATLKRLVADVNSGKLGVAVTDQQGRVVSLLGSEKALDGAEGPAPGEVQGAGGENGGVSAQNSISVDGWGLHYYLDSAWTRKLRARRASSAISAIAGSIAYWLCTFGVVCLSKSSLVSWVRSTLRSILVRTRVSTAAVHVPWSGYVYVQAGGYWYSTWLWI